MVGFEQNYFSSLSYALPPLDLALVKCAIATSVDERTLALAALHRTVELLAPIATDRPAVPFLCLDAVNDLADRANRLVQLVDLLDLAKNSEPLLLVKEISAKARSLQSRLDGNHVSWQITKEDLDRTFGVALSDFMNKKSEANSRSKWQEFQLDGANQLVASREIKTALGGYLSWLDITSGNRVSVVRGSKGARRYSWNCKSNGIIEYHTPSDLPRGLFVLWDLPHNLAHVAHLLLAAEGASTEFTDSPSSRFYYEAVATMAEHDLRWMPTAFSESYEQIRKNETVLRRTRFEVEKRVFRGLTPTDAIETTAREFAAKPDSVANAWRSHSSLFGTASSFHVGPLLLSEKGFDVKSAIFAGEGCLNE